MIEMFHRIMQGGLTRDEARRERREEQSGPQRPRPFIFQFEPPGETFKFRIQFKKSHVSRDELISTLREILTQLEGSSSEAAPRPPRSQFPPRNRQLHVRDPSDGLTSLHAKCRPGSGFLKLPFGPFG